MPYCYECVLSDFLLQETFKIVPQFKKNHHGDYLGGLWTLSQHFFCCDQFSLLHTIYVLFLHC